MKLELSYAISNLLDNIRSRYTKSFDKDDVIKARVLCAELKEELLSLELDILERECDKLRSETR